MPIPRNATFVSPGVATSGEGGEEEEDEAIAIVATGDGRRRCCRSTNESSDARPIPIPIERARMTGDFDGTESEMEEEEKEEQGGEERLLEAMASLLDDDDVDLDPLVAEVKGQAIAAAAVKEEEEQQRDAIVPYLGWRGAEGKDRSVIISILRPHVEKKREKGRRGCERERKGGEREGRERRERENHEKRATPPLAPPVSLSLALVTQKNSKLHFLIFFP